MCEFPLEGDFRIQASEKIAVSSSDWDGTVKHIKSNAQHNAKHDSISMSIFKLSYLEAVQLFQWKIQALGGGLFLSGLSQASWEIISPCCSFSGIKCR